ncbi:MAG: protein-export chaperone SecB [Planctomycetes bacterium]|nr:protein-export chaperone SecB [Planctomycetota bacterium]
MIPSPLKLETYCFTSIHFEASTEKNTKDASLRVTTSAKYHEDNPRVWMVELRLCQEKTKKEIPPYLFDITAVGIFEVGKEIEDDRVPLFASVNGNSILYSAIRELVGYLSSKGPHPKVQLPVVSFIDQLQNQTDLKEKKISVVTEKKNAKKNTAKKKVIKKKVAKKAKRKTK